jgi:DNA-directed RNA polymerase subunit RPC12/RpoP
MSSTPQRFACKGCGAEQYFAPDKKGLACNHCGAGEPLPPPAGFTAPEHPLILNAPGETPPPLPSAAAQGYGLEMAQRKCKQCGAAMSVPAKQKTSECAFCGSKFVEENVSTAQVEAPETVLPLAISTQQARQLYTDWIKKGWFTPSALKRENQLENLQGFYLPFWTFDAKTHSDWTAERGTYYYTTESYTVNGRTQTRQVQHTRWSPAAGRRDDLYDDVLVPAARADIKTLLVKVEGFDTKTGLVPYAPAYLAGWGALAYSVDKAEAWTEAEAIIRGDQERKCGSDVGGDTHRFLNVLTKFFDPFYKHTLLPYWICSYRYHDKVFQFVINGQTGKIAGTKPVSWLKVTLAVLFALAVIGLFILANKDG